MAKIEDLIAKEDFVEHLKGLTDYNQIIELFSENGIQVAKEEASKSVGEIPFLSFAASVIKEIPVSLWVALHCKFPKYSILKFAILFTLYIKT